MKKSQPGFPVITIKYLVCPFLILALLPAGVFAFSGGESADGKQNIVDLMSRFVLQLGVIVVIARTAGILLKRVKLPIPSALVELLIGVAIGPSLLGGMPLPGFPEGLFKLAPAAMTTAMPVSTELYGIATVASIIMLFSAGLETNLSLLLRYSLIGLLVAAGGVILSFAAGAMVTIYFGELLGHPGLTLSNPAVLFMGMIGMSTSLAVTARILSEKRKMDSPEGVTILAAAVLDDIMGIVILTVVMSIVLTSGGAAGGGTGTMHTVQVIAQAIGVLVAFTVAGIVFARPLSKLIKKFKTVAFISIFAFGLALIISGIFQKGGVAMIIGAYVVGLSLSKTDLGDTVRDSLEVMYDFFVPFFFIVMGMLVDVNAIMSKEVLLFGAIYSVAMFCGKFFGCGIPTTLMNFNHFGTIRIGMGLAPRGELAIIIAGIGLATMLPTATGEAAILDSKFFGVAILMVLINNIIAPPLQSILFESKRKGTRKDVQVHDNVITPVAVASRKMTEFLVQRILAAFRSEGFFSHTIQEGMYTVYHLRKNDMHIALHAEDTQLIFESDTKDVAFIKTVAYETLLQINDIVSSVKNMINPENMLKEITKTSDTGLLRAAAAIDGAGSEASPDGGKNNTPAPQPQADTTRKMDAGEIKHALTQGSIIPTLTAKSKREVIEKLIGILHGEGLVEKSDEAINAVMEREASMSTGMQNGIALPHARTDAVDKITVAVGLAPRGIDYQSLDGEPSKIFVLILSPVSSDSPHIQFLANISALLTTEESRAKLLACNTQEAIYNFFKGGLGSK